MIPVSAGRRHPVALWRNWSFELRATGYGLRAMGYGL